MDNIKRRYILATLFISIVLSIATHIAPMFLGLPKWIYVNIAGTFLISYAFGSIAGVVYACLLNIVLNNIGMGSGVIIYVLLTQMVEAGLIGLLNMKGSRGVFDIVLISVILSIVIKPISIVFYSIFNGEFDEFVPMFISIYLKYLKMDVFSNLVTYLISGIIAYFTYKGINKVILKERKELFL
jgi:hypothetical protein